MKTLLQFVLVFLVFATPSIYPQTIDNQDETFILKTNDLANSFHILDQVTGSITPFFQLPEYKSALESMFKHNINLLFSYKELRMRHQDIPAVFAGDMKTSSGLFAPNLDAFKDPICDAFFTSTHLNEALGKLKEILENSEIKLIENVFAAFANDFDAVNARSRTVLQKNCQRLNNTLNQTLVLEHFSKMRQFYCSPARNFKSILLLWTPNEMGFSGNCYGDHLIIRVPNKLIQDTVVLQFMISIIVHEATHHISANAPEKQKSDLSSIFLQTVDEIEKNHPLMLLEEPMVMATQIIFVKEACPEVLNLIDSPLAQCIVPIIEGYLSTGQHIDANFINRYTSEYKELSTTH